MCSEDPALAKRVRFLLGRDECHIEILNGPDSLGPAIDSESYDLLVLSRTMADVDVREHIEQLGEERPPTLVLGGEPISDIERVHVVHDPSNAQAIYGAASRILAGQTPDASAQPPAPQLPSMPTPNPGRNGAGTGASSAASQPVDPAKLARCIHRHNAARDDGELTVQRNDERWTLTFSGGLPVRVHTSRKGDRFGRHLVEAGRLSAARYAEAAMFAVEKGQNLGDALVATQALSEEDLRRERADYARIQLIAHFEPGEATFRFEAIPFSGDPDFELDVLPVVAEGFKTYADLDLVEGIIGERRQRYFRLRTPPREVQELFRLTETEVAFLEHGGRAYNVEDAAENSGEPVEAALKLLGLLWTCDEVEDFTPGVDEFEARIREERTRGKEAGSQTPMQAMSSEFPNIDEPFDGQISTGTPVFEAPVPLHSRDIPDVPLEVEEPVPLMGSSPSAPPSALPYPASPAGSLRPSMVSPHGRSNPPPATPPPAPVDDVPQMPSAAPGTQTGEVEPLVFAAPNPRDAEGNLVETPERVRSREHFQQGVQLLGQGHFDGAEQAFREAITLCAEEHVYLVGLARSIFYNPGYEAQDKLSVLESIVSRAESLAPQDKRVITLRGWVDRNR